MFKFNPYQTLEACMQIAHNQTLFVYHIFFLSLPASAALNAKLHIASCSPSSHLFHHLFHVCVYVTMHLLHQDCSVVEDC